MAEFLELDDGALVPVHAVSILRPAQLDTGTHLRKFTVIDRAGHQLGKTCECDLPRGVTIQANPGWALGRVFWPEEGITDAVTISSEVILAWRIDSTMGSAPVPVTVHGPVGDREFVIVAPNGEVTGQGGSWHSLEAARAGLLARWQERNDELRLVEADHDDRPAA